jgi:hypothetical protein
LNPGTILPLVILRCVQNDKVKVARQPLTLHYARDEGRGPTTFVFRPSSFVYGMTASGGLQPGKKVFATIFEVCPLVALLFGRK